MSTCSSARSCGSLEWPLTCGMRMKKGDARATSAAASTQSLPIRMRVRRNSGGAGTSMTLDAVEFIAAIRPRQAIERPAVARTYVFRLRARAPSVGHAEVGSPALREHQADARRTRHAQHLR